MAAEATAAETTAALDRVGLLLDAVIGLRTEATLRSRMRRCVLDAAASRALPVERYVDSLAGDDAAIQDLLDRVTVQETGFFRHPKQFRALADHVLPAVPGRVRIWCAAAANGQEPYSLAMVLAEQGRAGSVLATDVSSAALRRTIVARYSDRELTSLSAARRAAYLTCVDGDWQVSEAVRQMVTVRAHNLLRPIPAEVANCQIVFCRNVLIYLTAEHTRVFLDRLADMIAPGSYLFVGSAETIWNAADRFEPVHVDGTFVYQARARASRTGPAQPPARSAAAPRARRLPPAPSAPPAPNAAPTANAAPAPNAAPTPNARPAPNAAPAPNAPLRAVTAPAEAGRQAVRMGDPASAVTAFRRWVFLEPDDPQSHLHLALALEAVGDDRAARRAFRSARAALDHAGPAQLAAALGRYDVAELHRLLAEKGTVQSP